ncbi:MAG: hypothetical protein ACRDK4_11905 [Solirubrobacteraceae bacterium]
MSTTTAVAQPGAPRARATTTATLPQSTPRQVHAETRERDQLLDRLGSLRRVLPVLAQEMASARRQAAHLRIDNRRLTDQVRELRAQLQAREH